MNIKTYTAKDMRSALRQVREEQGADAVILSTRHLPEGVEVAVAIESQVGDAVLPEMAPARAPVVATAPIASPGRRRSSRTSPACWRRYPRNLARKRHRWRMRASATNCAACATCWNGSSRSWPGMT